ncbi:MAG: ABC transporter ATP-binding protein [Lutispora sp.]
MIILTVSNIFCGYDSKDVIKGISLDIEQGDNLCLIGPNGCGKTTLLKALAHLMPYRGSVKLNEIEVSQINRKNLAKDIALMTQINSIYFPYTVYETVSLGRYAHTKGMFSRLTAFDKDIIDYSLEKVGLTNMRKSKINELSGGQLQRVFLAKIFAQDPKVILLDEPTNHLDLKCQIELLEYIKEWTKQRGRAMVAVLHDLNLVQMYADKVLLLNQGSTQGYGTPGDVLSNGALEEVYNIDIKHWMTKVLTKWVI